MRGEVDLRKERKPDIVDKMIQQRIAKEKFQKGKRQRIAQCRQNSKR